MLTKKLRIKSTNITVKEKKKKKKKPLTNTLKSMTCMYILYKGKDPNGQQLALEIDQ